MKTFTNTISETSMYREAILATMKDVGSNNEYLTIGTLMMNPTGLCAMNLDDDVIAEQWNERFESYSNAEFIRFIICCCEYAYNNAELNTLVGDYYVSLGKILLVYNNRELDDDDSDIYYRSLGLNTAESLADYYDDCNED